MTRSKTAAATVVLVVLALVFGSLSRAHAASLASSLLPPDPARESYVASALTYNLALRQKGLSIAEARARVAEARASFFPTLGFEARATERYGAVVDFGPLVNPIYSTLNQQLGASFPTNLQVALPLKRETKVVATQPLFAPALYDRYELRQEETAQARDEWRVFAGAVRAEVQAAYFQHARAVSVVALLDQTRPLLDENLRVSTLLVAQDKVTEDAVFRARAELASWDVSRAEAADGVEAARRYLNFLAHRPLDTPVPEMPTWEPPALGLDEESALGHARERAELDVLAAGRRVAGRAVKLARDAYYPTLGAAAEYGFQGDKYDFSLDRDYLLLSLVLKFNVWNGFGDQARAAQAQKTVERLELADEELRERIEMEVRRAFRAARTARTAIDKLGPRVDSMRASYDIVARRYAAGAAPPIELLDARTARTRAELDQVLARYDFAAKLVELERVAALQGEIAP